MTASGQFVICAHDAAVNLPPRSHIQSALQMYLLISDRPDEENNIALPTSWVRNVMLKMCSAIGKFEGLGVKRVRFFQKPEQLEEFKKILTAEA